MSVYASFPGLSQHAREIDIALPPRIVDLANTFPLLFFMLACDSGSFARRLEVFRLVSEGRSLAEVAAAFGLPFCLRRLRADACLAPLPWVEWSQPASPQLANHIPAEPIEAGNWLAVVFGGARACGEEFALWLARQRALSAGTPLDCRQLLPLALYAWYSTNASPLDCIIATPWSRELGLPRAMDEADAWLTRLHMLTYSGTYPIADTWLEPGVVDGYEFRPITTFEELISERHALRNCLHTYVDKISSGACRVFTIKKDGRSVAALELVPESNGQICIVQLKGPGNVRAPNDIHAAARTWAERQRDRRVSPMRRISPLQAAGRLAEWWRPYQAATGRGANPLPSIAALKELLGNLRRHVTITQQSAALQNGQPPAAMPIAGVAPLAAVAIDDACRAHAHLRTRVGDDVYVAWFNHLEFDAYDGQIVRASVPVRFLQRWIEAHYADLLRTCCAMVWPRVEAVEVVLRNAMPAEPQPPPALFDALHGGIRNPTRIRIDYIISLVSARYALSRADILSERRHRDVVRARQIVMYLARQLTNRATPEIGRSLGGRDHTTVLHAIRRIEAQMAIDPRLREDVEQLRRAATEIVRPDAGQ